LELETWAFQRFGGGSAVLGGPIYGTRHSSGGVPFEAEGGDFFLFGI